MQCPFARTGMFLDDAAYMNITYSLLALTRGQNVKNGYVYNGGFSIGNLVWLGAQSTSNGTYLQHYHWMNNMTQIGSQVSPTGTMAPVSLSPGSVPSVLSPFCLAINISDPSIFYGRPCTDANNVICEYGIPPHLPRSDIC